MQSKSVFWVALTSINRQDLNSCVIAGSSRIVDHTTFDELQWRRDVFSPNHFQLAPGFQSMSQLLTEDLIEVLEDVHALQRIRETARFPTRDLISMAYINNHQASIQSRLMGLATLSPILECCRLAAYLCSSMLCCTVWCALVIPVCSLYKCVTQLIAFPPPLGHSCSLMCTQNNKLVNWPGFNVCWSASHSLTFLYNWFENWNKKVTVRCGKLILISYSGSCTWVGLSHPRGSYVLNMSRSCAAKSFLRSEARTNPGRNCLSF